VFQILSQKLTGGKKRASSGFIFFFWNFWKTQKSLFLKKMGESLKNQIPDIFGAQNYSPLILGQLKKKNHFPFFCKTKESKPGYFPKKKNGKLEKIHYLNESRISPGAGWGGEGPPQFLFVFNRAGFSKVFVADWLGENSFQKGIPRIPPPKFYSQLNPGGKIGGDPQGPPDYILESFGEWDLS